MCKFSLLCVFVHPLPSLISQDAAPPGAATVGVGALNTNPWISISQEIPTLPYLQFPDAAVQ